ncbi:MAG: hypothetical protein P4N59_33850 [Negativicutes bacterium]|nr:hypothetical protein [Negativicutes bacterium]
MRRPFRRPGRCGRVADDRPGRADRDRFPPAGPPGGGAEAACGAYAKLYAEAADSTTKQGAGVRTRSGRAGMGGFGDVDFRAGSAKSRPCADLWDGPTLESVGFRQEAVNIEPEVACETRDIWPISDVRVL